MSKYNYDKSSLKGLGVGDFLNEVKVRDAHINEGENTIPTSIYNPNIVSSKLHPAIQYGKIRDVVDHGEAKTFVIEPNEEMGTTELAFFKAGQYVAFDVDFNGAKMRKPYSLCSSPKDAQEDTNNTYAITVKKTANGYASEYILNNWKQGSEISFSGPQGQFTYERLRDSKNVVALAGGSGITPFVSMAHTIVDGLQDFNLTILYGNRDHKNILLKDELDDLANKSNGKIKVVYVLSDDNENGFEHGFISAELIKKYAPDDYSIFVCGPKAMYKYVEGEIAKLNLPIRKVRFELSGEYGDPTNDEKYPKEFAGKEFNVKVWVRGESVDIKCKAEETLIHACETAGIKVPSDCRSGRCGWCHSRLIKGETYIPESNDGRRLADKKFGWIHPCSTYPLSDIEMEVFPIK